MTPNDTESVLDLDESKVLGYFESIRGVFLTKLIFVYSHLDKRSTKLCFVPTSVPEGAIEEVRNSFDEPLFYQAFENKNPELYLNMQDDIITSTIMSSWSIFELIIKDLRLGNYAQSTDQQSPNYMSCTFQFTNEEKNDLELFYYIRNAMLHYNGAYYAAKNINHRYKGKDFNSVGHVGEKIEATMVLAWDIATDLMTYTLKAWGSAKTRKKL